jgi:hypothetical protein
MGLSKRERNVMLPGQYFDHPGDDIKPHWDYVDLYGGQHRLYPDGTAIPKTLP